jgi:response regulator of citrate/malate metabolism
VLLTSQNDTGLLTFMAEKTIENTDLDKETKNSAIKNKVSQIQAINSLATNQNMCFRKGIIDYFIEKKPIRSKSLALRIVEWLFSTKKKKNTSKWCCDRCNHVTIYNYLHSVQSLLKHNE